MKKFQEESCKKEYSIIEIIRQNEQELLALLSLSNMKILKQNSNGESCILLLFLKYLSLKLDMKNNLGAFHEVFKLNDLQQEIFFQIRGNLEQWYLELFDISQQQTNKNFNLYVEVLKKKISSSQFFILPAGFKMLNIDRKDFNYINMLEESYQGPHSLCLCIKKTKEGFNQISVIDPLSPYQTSVTEISKDRTNQGIIIEDVPDSSISLNFLKQLMSIKTNIPYEAYSYSDLYEIILSQLEGNSYFSNTENDYYELDERKFQSLPFTLVKKVFLSLLKPNFQFQEKIDIFKKFILEFQFVLLTNIFQVYQTMNFKQKTQGIENYEFLLNEMSNWVALEASSLQDINKKMISDQIEKIQQLIKQNFNYRNQNIKLDKNLQNLNFQHSNFKQYLPTELKDLKFIKDQFFSYGNSHQSQIKQYNFINIQSSELESNSLKKVKQLDQLLKKLVSSSTQSLDKTIQICLAVENFVFSFINEGFSGWYEEENDIHEISKILLNAASLYYNCFTIIFYQLFPSGQSVYDPNYYTKLVLVMFSLLALMQEIVKNDQIINLQEQGFTTSISLSDALSLQQILPQLSIPNRKWYSLLKIVQSYYETQMKLFKKYLFDYKSIQKSMYQISANQEIEFIINLIYDTNSSLRAELQNIEIDPTLDIRKIWLKILFSSNYMPKLLLNFRDISYLTQLTLISFTPSFNTSFSKYGFYDQMKLSYNFSNFTNVSIMMGDVKYNKNVTYHQTRFTDYYLSEDDQEYQKIILSRFDKDSYFSENDVISKQNQKPVYQSIRQFYSQSFIQINDNLKFVYLYIALKNQEIQLDKGQEVFLVKQVIHKLKNLNGECELITFMGNEDFSMSLIEQFIKIGFDLKEKLTQSQSLYYLIDILIYLHSFCKSNAQSLIEKYFQEIREKIISQLNNRKEYSTQLSILCSIGILSFKIKQELNQKDLEIIFNLRIKIENNFRMNAKQPFIIYYNLMEFLHSCAQLFLKMNKLQLEFLNAYIIQKNCIWQFNKNNYYYSYDSYTYIPLKGRIIKNGLPLTGLPNQIISSQLYKDYCNNQHILFEITNHIYEGRCLTAYESKTSQNKIIRISILNYNHLWIQEQGEDNDEFKTFVSQNYLQKLPRYLQKSIMFSQSSENNYHYWYQNNLIQIQNSKGIGEYCINLLHNEIICQKSKQYILPFDKSLEQSFSLYNIFSQIEDVNYILAYKVDKEDKIPTSLHLLRLGLSFNIYKKQLNSNEFKDYYLSSNQYLDSLIGVQQYLILEQIDHGICTNKQRKLIIPHHPIKVDNNINKTITFDLQEVCEPSYFSYDINDHLGILNSEITSGNLFISLLYFKIGSTQIDKLTSMNSFENTAEALNNCWQNQEYNDIEFNLILQFFDSSLKDQSNILNQCKNQQNNLQKIFQQEDHGIRPENINSHAIYLRLILLLIDSYSTDFMIEANKIKKQIFLYLFQTFFNYHFSFYLIFKDRMFKRCLLSEKDEIKLIQHFQNYFSIQELDQRIQNYYNFQTNQGSIFSINHLALDYKQTKRNFSKNQSQVHILVSQIFESMIGKIQNSKIYYGNNISEWKRNSFDIGNFLQLFKDILNLHENKTLDQETFSYFLQFLFLQNIKKKQSNLNILINILFQILQQKEKFKTISIPKFLDCNYDMNYYSLKDQSQIFSMKSMPGLGQKQGRQGLQIKNKIIDILRMKYINSNDKCIVSIEELNDINNMKALSNKIENVFSSYQKQGSLQCFLEIQNRLIEIRKNYEYCQFFMAICQKYNQIDKVNLNISNIMNLSQIFCQLNKKQIIEQIYSQQYHSQSSKCEEQQLEWKVKSIDLQAFIQDVNKSIDQQLTYPEDISFLFDDFLQQDTKAKHILSSGYGENSVQQLKQSYGDLNNDQSTYNNQEFNNQKVGYIQQPQIHYSFKEDYQIDNFKKQIMEWRNIIENNNQQLYGEIESNILKLQGNVDVIENIILLRLCKKFSVPNTSDILSLVINNEGFNQINPLISKIEQNLIQSKIIQYIEQFSLGQQIDRTLILINKFEENNNNDERERLLQTILQSVKSQRCYPAQEIPFNLLFEFQNNILIRENQYHLASSMFNDSDNCIYQLNMGEGKTSVILILLCQMIANGKSIARINCLESLLGVMQDITKKKFSGLIRKKIYILPFQREVEFSTENINKLYKILEEIREGKHILLITPEQHLCLQLKQEETLLELLNTKDADNTFNWELHFKKFNKDYKSSNQRQYQLNSHQKSLSQILIKLGFIDSKSVILKYPENKQSFYQSINQIYNEQKGLFFKGYSKFIYKAYAVFRMNSTKLKEQLEKRIDMLNKIDQFTFIDILDESDEILRHGKELNYTLGKSQQLDGGNSRWEIPFLIFRLIFFDSEIINCFKEISQIETSPIVFNPEFKPRSEIGGGVFLFRFVDRQFFEDQLKPLITQKLSRILRKKFDEPNERIFDIQTQQDYGSFEDFLQGKFIQQENQIINYFKNKGQDILNSFLLAKGWISHNLLYHVLSYRYRVEYGLHEKREKEIAIPFKGKDLPSEKSEFSHPDIMIGFTILSYLYNGLTFKQFIETILLIKNEQIEDKNSILKQWVDESKGWILEYTEKQKIDYPEWLKSIKSFEIEDNTKMELAFNCLCRNFKVVKYYLSNFTFPNYAKHYKRRITGNAHSLASENVTKGFSGTDDKNETMPESVVPKRLISQESTNGKMIHILSRTINSTYEPKKLLNSKEFLEEVCNYIINNQNCQILIDAGAVVTEMSNFDVSQYLINNIDQRFKGIVYFSDETNKINVFLRNQQIISFSSCHLDINNLFIYLDESHTRGSDFKLPISARAILTIGRGMNKDKLMQAAMRLRDLDYKQSIVLWGLEEVSSDIAKMNGININEINSKHVILWASANTVLKNEKDLYYVLFLKLKNHIKNRALKLQKKYSKYPFQSLISQCENKVQEGILDLYQKSPQMKNPKDLLLRQYNKLLTKFYEDCKLEVYEKLKSSKYGSQFNFLDQSNLDEDTVLMKSIILKMENKLPKMIMTYDSNFDCDEENEQEEIEEIQQQEQVQSYKQATSLKEENWNFSSILDLNFIEKCLENKSFYPKLFPIKKCFDYTSYNDLKIIKWSNQIYATKNFIETIKYIDVRSGLFQNEYLRPVNMVLAYAADKVRLILLSGQEAYQIVKVIKAYIRSDIFLFHIDDINGPTMIPQNININQSDHLYHLITVIKLFNGDFYFKNEEIQSVRKCLGFIDHNSLQENQELSIKFYKQLQQRQFIQNGFFTTKLLMSLNNKQNGNEIGVIEQELQVKIKDKLNQILQQSILDDNQVQVDFIILFQHIAQIRGKSNFYQKSSLKSLLEINKEWNI